MVINRLKRALAVLLSLLFCVPSLCCCGQKSVSNREETTHPVSTAVESPLGERCHFSTFNIYVPEGWEGKGNSGKLYTPEDGDDWFLLVNKGDDPEQGIQELLGLFFNTEYYVDDISFSYTYSEAVKNGRQVEGKLLNERMGTEKWFSGFFMTTPSCYFLFFCDDAEEVIPMRMMAGNCYESIEPLE